MYEKKENELINNSLLLVWLLILLLNIALLRINIGRKIDNLNNEIQDLKLYITNERSELDE